MIELGEPIKEGKQEAAALRVPPTDSRFARNRVDALRLRSPSTAPRPCAKRSSRTKSINLIDHKLKRSGPHGTLFA